MVTEVPPQVFGPTPAPEVSEEPVPTPEEIVDEEPPLAEPGEDGEPEEIADDEIPTAVPKTGEPGNAAVLLTLAGLAAVGIALKKMRRAREE